MLNYLTVAMKIFKLDDNEIAHIFSSLSKLHADYSYGNKIEPFV